MVRQAAHFLPLFAVLLHALTRLCRRSVVDQTCLGVFLIEFVARIGSALYIGKIVPFLSVPMNWVDLLSIAPYYCSKFFDVGFDARYVRIVRLFRVFSVVKTLKFGNINEIVDDIYHSAAAAMMVPIFFMGLAMIVFSSLMYNIEQGKYMGLDADGKREYVLYTSYVSNRTTGARSPEQATGSFDSIVTTFWWCIVTFTTVGYGDKYPITPVGRLLCVVAMFCGVFFLAMPVAIVGGAFESAWRKFKHRRDTAMSNVSASDPASVARRSEMELLRVDLRNHVKTIDRHVAHFLGEDVNGLRKRPAEEFEVWSGGLCNFHMFEDDLNEVWDMFLDVQEEQGGEELNPVASSLLAFEVEERPMQENSLYSSAQNSVAGLG